MFPFKVKGKPRHIEHIRIDEEFSSKMGKPAGEYITLYSEGLEDDKLTEDLVGILNEMLSNLLHGTKEPKFLVVGLGNSNITPDSLGVRVAERFLATAHFAGHPEFDELGLQRVYVFTPRVMAQTGFESAEQIKFIAAGMKPDCLIVVDSLACESLDRLGKTIQITDTGLLPGSGVNNNRCGISKEVLGCPVVAVGVPMVVELPEIGKEMLVPRDIDLLLNRFTKVIANAINTALNPSLTYSEIQDLIT